MKRILQFFIRLYQKTRVFRTPCCRFYPSCSDYAHDCLQKHGLLKSSFLISRRLLLCQPLYPGGIDEVPAEFSWNSFAIFPGGNNNGRRVLVGSGFKKRVQ